MSATVEAPVKVWTKEEIKAKLAISNLMLYKSIIEIYNRQTATEQAIQGTAELNGIGFNGPDSFILSSFAEQLLNRGVLRNYDKNRKYLSDKQMAIARKKMLKYAGQLTKIANKQI